MGFKELESRAKALNSKKNREEQEAREQETLSEDVDSSEN